VLETFPGGFVYNPFHSMQQHYRRIHLGHCVCQIIGKGKCMAGCIKTEQEKKGHNFFHPNTSILLVIVFLNKKNILFGMISWQSNPARSVEKRRDSFFFLGIWNPRGIIFIAIKLTKY
jgi:hypothetical protein